MKQWFSYKEPEILHFPRSQNGNTLKYTSIRWVTQKIVGKINLDKNLLWSHLTKLKNKLEENQILSSNLTTCQNKAQGCVKEYKNTQHKVECTISNIQSTGY